MNRMSTSISDNTARCYTRKVVSLTRMRYAVSSRSLTLIDSTNFKVSSLSSDRIVLRESSYTRIVNISTSNAFTMNSSHGQATLCTVYTEDLSYWLPYLRTKSSPDDSKTLDANLLPCSIVTRYRWNLLQHLVRQAVRRNGPFRRPSI